jgi:hypothetical protein
MIKKEVIVRIIVSLGIISISTGCSDVKNIGNVEKTVINQTVQKETSDIESFTVPNFKGIYDNTVEVDINFESNGMYSSNKGIKIKDAKMLSDVLTMIGKSQLITDESKISNMSGMATKNNSLMLVEKNGSKKEIKFAFDDPAFAVGYLEIDEKKYDPGFSFFRYIRDFTEYRQFDTNIDNRAIELFGEYNWTIDYRINTIETTLPSDLKHEAGEYPIEIYWAYNNELSKNIGLNYSDYLGKQVEVDIYRLREPLPDFLSPRMDARGIVLRYDKEIIGAYIDAGRHNTFACSLDRKSLKELTKKEWDNWVSDYIDYKDELENKLSKMKPEEIIKEYYDAINSHDQKREFACLTRQNICNYLGTNMDNNLLTNQGFNDVFMDDEHNIESAKFIELRKIDVSGNHEGTVEYEVTIDYKFKKEITSSNGKQPRFIILKKETEKSGWRIQSEGTGP